MKYSHGCGRIEVRPRTRIEFDRRMKPKSWSSRYWFGSALFARGTVKRRIKFRQLMDRIHAR